MTRKNYSIWTLPLLVFAVMAAVAFGASQKIEGTCYDTTGCKILKQASEALKAHTFKPGANISSGQTMVTDSHDRTEIGSVTGVKERRSVTCTGIQHCDKLAAACTSANGAYTAGCADANGVPQCGTCTY